MLGGFLLGGFSKLGAAYDAALGLLAPYLERP
jgi:hypothetical protein